MRIDRNSYGTLAGVYAIALAAAIPLAVFVPSPWVKWPLLFLLLWFCIWQTMFFMVPVRRPAGSGSILTSVADGRVVIAENTFESEVLGREAVQISVYMNFFDVHANFWPLDAEVVSYDYHPGAHFLAFHPKSSLENEHTCVLLRNADGKEILFKQIAGGFARRIVCKAVPGLMVRAGEQCGIIKFGSRIDIFVPVGSDIRVKVGDLVRSCETVLAEIR